MKFEAINKKFTERVAEIMMKGYWINAGTMSGSQGEYAHVDLTNGTELYRVYMEDRCGWGEADRVVIVVGKCVDENVKIGANDRLGNTVWNNRLEVISEDTFYKIGRNWREQWYGTKEESDAAEAKADARREARKDSQYKTREFKGVEKIALRFAKRAVVGCKTAKVSDITKVEKVYHTNHNGECTKVMYFVTVRGKRVRMA